MQTEKKKNPTILEMLFLDWKYARQARAAKKKKEEKLPGVTFVGKYAKEIKDIKDRLGLTGSGLRKRRKRERLATRISLGTNYPKGQTHKIHLKGA